MLLPPSADWGRPKGPRKEEIVTLHKVYLALLAIKKYADGLGVPIANAHIEGTCGEIRESHMSKSRYYAHAFHEPYGGICVHPAIEELPQAVVTGIIVHEVGHVVSSVREDGSAEPSADQWVRDNLGLEVRYDPKNTLQFLDEEDMQKLGIS